MNVRTQLSFRQYRRIDLAFFALILFLCEALITLAATRWFPGEPYVLSITGAVCAVVMFRWGAFSGIHAVLGALVLCLLSRAPAKDYLIYCLGNLLSLAALVPLKRIGWEKLKESSFKCMAFGLLTTVLMQTGRAAVSLFFSRNLSFCLMYYTTDILSGFFAVILMWIARRLDGILEEQGHYVKRISKELNSETDSINAGRLDQ